MSEESHEQKSKETTKPADGQKSEIIDAEKFWLTYPLAFGQAQ